MGRTDAAVSGLSATGRYQRYSEIEARKASRARHISHAQCDLHFLNGTTPDRSPCGRRKFCSDAIWIAFFPQHGFNQLHLDDMNLDLVHSSKQYISKCRIAVNGCARYLYSQNCCVE
jgi:hypothetical protein